MKLDLVTIFPEYFGPLRQSLLGKAIERGLVSVAVHDLRDWAGGVHRSVDDAPYGGGPGMVMRPEPWQAALDAVATAESLLVVPSPSGVPFTQRTAQQWLDRPHLVFACGRYEGIDQRVIDAAAERMAVAEVSLGDYVLAGGEVAALVMIEAVTRLIPGVVGNATSITDDSFATGLLEGPAYTRPERWGERPVPPVLLSGHHGQIERWRRDQALLRTARRRPELLAALPPDTLGERDRVVLTEAGFHLPDPGVAP